MVKFLGKQWETKDKAFCCFSTFLLVEEKKVSINSYDDEEWRPLHFAASKGFGDIVVFLVRRATFLLLCLWCCDREGWQ